MTHILAGIAWAMDNVVDASTYGVVLGVGVVMVHAVVTARRPPRWRRPVDPPARIDPDVCAERLIDELARGPLRTRASILAGDVPCSARWMVALELPRHGYWIVTVGPYEGVAADLSVVYAIVHGRLTAIAADRGELRGGR